MKTKKKVGGAPTLKELPTDDVIETLKRALGSVDGQVHTLKLAAQNRQFEVLWQGWRDLMQLTLQTAAAVQELNRRRELR